MVHTGIHLLMKNLKNWQSKLGYVPQQISLLDASLAENIAFGVKADEINMKKVLKASQISCLHDFVSNNLEDEYNTTIGERGVKLSGGQRQRLSLARAFFRGAKVLVLDEATSALDSEVETIIQESLATLMQGKTVIAIIDTINFPSIADGTKLIFFADLMILAPIASPIAATRPKKLPKKSPASKAS